MEPKDPQQQVWHRSTFAIGGEGKDYVGFIFGDHWNGWACPTFERAVAEDILTTEELTWTYDEAKDSFHIARDSEEGTDWDEDYSGYDIVLEDGTSLHVYAIGAYFWIWDDMAE